MTESMDDRVMDFNPHHHAGGDAKGTKTQGQEFDFNPHHHAGGDAIRCPLTYYQGDFNPHHHAGGDSGAGLVRVHTYRFQSTPPRRW